MPRRPYNGMLPRVSATTARNADKEGASSASTKQLLSKLLGEARTSCPEARRSRSHMSMSKERVFGHSGLRQSI
eukprot:3081240-Amphidinium_carterae.2